MKRIQPESFYRLDHEMSFDKLADAMSSKEIVVGQIIYWNSQAKHFVVDLGNNFTAILPLEESSFYPLFSPTDGSIKYSKIYNLVGKTICACVKSCNNFQIVISRKESMEMTFKEISENGLTIYCCEVLFFSGVTTFVDIGNGIIGAISIKDLTISKISHPNDIGIYVNSIIHAKLLSIDSELKYIYLSYRSTFNNLSNVLQKDDLITAMVFESVDDEESGYFAQINPNTAAIVNPPDDGSLNYGSKVVARVRKVKDNGFIKLAFTSYFSSR